MSVARTSTTWDIVVRNLAVRQEVIDDTSSATVTWTATLNGSAYDTGTLAWEAFDYERAWTDQFLLPPTPGILKVVVNVNVTVDTGPAVGRLQQSIKVV